MQDAGYRIQEKNKNLRFKTKNLSRILHLVSCILCLASCIFLSGCASASKILGSEKLNVPPEFNQKVILEVSDNPKMFQAPRSGYDIGDLQAFQTQHTLPATAEDTFKQMFGQVEVAEEGAKIETSTPDVPAIFEVRLVDLANDIEMGATTYRAQVTLAVAMKSPRGNIFWHEVFRGDGFTQVDPQFSTGLGPQDAVLDAVRNAMDQMQKAIIASPQVRAQMKYYQDIENARRQKEVKV